MSAPMWPCPNMRKQFTVETLCASKLLFRQDCNFGLNPCCGASRKALVQRWSFRGALIHSVWRRCLIFCETVEDGRVHSCFKKRSRLAKRNNCAFPEGSLISAFVNFFEAAMLQIWRNDSPLTEALRPNRLSNRRISILKNLASPHGIPKESDFRSGHAQWGRGPL